MADTPRSSGDGGGGGRRRRTLRAGPSNGERTRSSGSPAASASVAAPTRSKANGRATELPRELRRGCPDLSGLRSSPSAATPSCEERAAGVTNAMAPICTRPQDRVVEEERRGVSEVVKNSASNSWSRDSNTSGSSRSGKEEQVSEHARNGNATSLPKKRKRIDSRTYLKLFKPFKRDIVVATPDRVSKETTPSGSVADDNIVMPCEGALLIEKKKSHSSNAVYKGLKNPLSGLHETSEIRVGQHTSPFSEVVVDGEELISVEETNRECHLSNDEPLNMTARKRIDLVDSVFSLREKVILEKQQLEISDLGMHTNNKVAKLKEVCDSVLEHIRRSHIDEMARNEKTKLIIRWFTMLLFVFLEHISLQHNKLRVVQSVTWSKEQKLKENLHQEAKSGQLDDTFDQCIALPDSNFVIEDFVHEPCIVGSSVTDCQQPSNAGLLMETTLLQNVVPSEPISAQPMHNDPVEISVDSGRGPASEALGISENNIHCSSNGVGLENVVSSNPISANNDSISQEPSIKECRNTEHVEVGNISNPTMSLGNATLPVRESNANGDGTLDSDQVRLELPILASSQILTTSPVSGEIGVHSNLSTMSASQSLGTFRHPPVEAEPANISSMPPQQSSDLSAPRNLVPSGCPLAEAEQTDMLGTQAVQDLQPEMQPSISMQDQTEQPALVHAEPAGAEGPSVLDTTAAPSEERGQIGFQTNTPGPEQPTQLLPPDIFLFDHHPLTSTEPLKNELERIKRSAISASKAHEQKRSLFLIEYNQEIEKIRSKYESLLQKEDSAYLERKAMLASIHNKVAVHQLLAEKFRETFNEYSPAQVASTSPVMEQALHFSSSAQTAASLDVLSSARPPSMNPFPLPGHHVPPSLIAQLSSEDARIQSILHGNLYGATSSSFNPVVVPRGSYRYAGAQPHLPPTRRHRQLRTQSPYAIHTNHQQQLHLHVGQQLAMASASISQQGLGSFSLQHLDELLGNFAQPPSPNLIPMMAGQSNQSMFFHRTLGRPNATQMAGVGQSGYGSTSSDVRRPGNVNPVVTCLSDDE